MAELVTNVDTAEGVAAAVQSGADAVCVRIASGGLSAGEFARACEFCRVRGVKIYASLPSYIPDQELAETVAAVRQAWLNGADAVRVNDVGLVLSIRRTIPDIPVHLGSSLNIHSVSGVQTAAAMGVSRVSLAPELSRKDLLSILSSSRIETEILAHGQLCPSYGGMCLMGSFAGTSGRGCCGRECLGEFDTGIPRKNHPFVIKDVCLSSHIEELTKSGVTALMLDGTGQRPEYTAVLTVYYSRAVNTGRLPTEDELNILTNLKPIELTDGYLTDNRDDMSGTVSPAPEESSSFLSAVRRGYLRREFQRVPVSFTGEVSLGGPLRLTATDDRGNVAEGEGGIGELAFHRELTLTSLQTELFRTGGTPFLCQSVKCRIPRGLTVEREAISGLRDKLLNELMEKRKTLGMRSTGKFTPPPTRPNSEELPVLTVSVLSADQLSPRILELAPPVIYIPLDEIEGNEEKLEQFIKCPGISVCAVLPCTIFDSELPDTASKLLHARQMGISEVQADNIGQIVFARQMGFSVRGGAGLNALSSGTLTALKSFGLSSVTLSSELTATEIAGISKHVPSELIVYGRIPLMVTNNCMIRSITGICSCDTFSGVTDSSGMLMPVIKTAGCRTTVYSSKKVFLARRNREYMKMGLWGVRLSFTTENPRECAAITERFLGLGNYDPSSYISGKF